MIIFFLSQTSRYIIHEFVSLKLYIYNFSWSDYLIRFSVKSTLFSNIVSPIEAVAFFFSFSLSQFNLILVSLSIIFFRKLSMTFSVVIQLHSKFFEVVSWCFWSSLRNFIKQKKLIMKLYNNQNVKLEYLNSS